MKFLLDENLSPLLAVLLAEAGHDTIHVRDIGLDRTSDEIIVDTARREDRAAVSADADFGHILARAALRRAKRLPVEQLDVSVDGEWSYIETLRHPVAATDRWFTGPVPASRTRYIGSGHNPALDEVPAGILCSRAKPSLGEVMIVRRERMDRVAEFLASVKTDGLDRLVASPNVRSTSVRSRLHVVFGEERWHNEYANRDLAIIESR